MERLEENIVRFGEQAIDGMNNILDSLNLTNAIKAQISLSGTDLQTGLPTFTNKKEERPDITG